MMIGEVPYKMFKYLILISFILRQGISLSQNVLPTNTFDFGNKLIDCAVDNNVIISLTNTDNLYLNLNIINNLNGNTINSIKFENCTNGALTIDTITKTAYLSLVVNDTFKLFSYNLGLNTISELYQLQIPNLRVINLIKSKNYNDFYIAGYTDSCGILFHLNLIENKYNLIKSKDAIFTPYRDLIFTQNSIIGIKRGNFDNQNNLRLSLFLDQFSDSLIIKNTVEILGDTENFYFNQTGAILNFNNTILLNTICKNKFAEEFLLMALYDENLNLIKNNLYKQKENDNNYILNNNICYKNNSIFSFTTRQYSDTPFSYNLIINYFNNSGQLIKENVGYLFENSNWALRKVFLHEDKITVAAFDKITNDSHKFFIYNFDDLINSAKPEVDFNTFSIYPNPINTEYLHFNLNNKIKFKEIELILLNNLGEIISRIPYDNENKVAVSNLKGGIYFIGISVNGIVSYKKFVKY